MNLCLELAPFHGHLIVLTEGVREMGVNFDQLGPLAFE